MLSCNMGNYLIKRQSERHIIMLVIIRPIFLSKHVFSGVSLQYFKKTTFILEKMFIEREIQKSLSHQKSIF